MSNAESLARQPLDTLSENRFQRLVKTAGVKRIKFHGCRHTVATLSLQAGTPPHGKTPHGSVRSCTANS